MKGFLRYIVLGGIFLVPFVPLIVSGTLFFPFITGKAFAYRIIVEIIFGAWVLLALLDRRFRPHYSHILSAVGIFLLVVLLADIGSENPYKSFWSNFERMEGFVAILHHCVFFLVVASTLTTERLWRRFFATSVGVSGLIAIYGMFQLAGTIVINQGGLRLDGTFGNATYLAGYMLFHVFLSLYLMFRWYGEEKHKEIYERVLPLCAAGAGLLLFLATWFFADTWFAGLESAGKGIALVGANIFALLLIPVIYLFWRGTRFVVPLAVSLVIGLELFTIYFTATRGAALGLFVGLLVSALIIAIFAKGHRALRIASFSFILLVAFVASGLYLARSTPFVKQNPILSRFVSVKTTMFTSRRLIWSMAWEGVKEHPVLGWGQESFNFVFNKQYLPELFSEEQWFDRTHNVILDWWISAGLLGLLAYLSLFVLLIYYLWKRNGDVPEYSVPEKAVLTGLIAGYLVHNFFVFDNIGSYILFFSFLGFFHSRFARPILRFENAREVSEDAVLRAGLPAVLVATVFLLYFFNVKLYIAGQTLIKAIQGQPKGLSQNIALFKKALSYKTAGDQEIREQLIQAAARVASLQGSAAEKAELLALAEKELKRQIVLVPTDARPYVFLGAFFGRMGRYGEALEYTRKAHELSPGKQSILFDLGGIYLGKGDIKTALLTFKQAFELAPENREARLIYAIAAIYAKNMQLARELLEPTFGTVEIDDDRIVKALYEAGEFRAVLHIWQKRVEKDPANYQKHISLAAAHYALGDRANTIKELKEAIRLEPKFKEQGEKIISDLKAGKNI